MCLCLHYVVFISLLLCHTVISQQVEYYPFGKKIQSKIEIRKELTRTTNSRFILGNKIYSQKCGLEWRLCQGQYHEGRMRNPKNSLIRKAADPVFHGYPKTKEELWHEHFIGANNMFDQTSSLIKLLHKVTITYLSDCIPVILYDNFVKSKESLLLRNLLVNFPISYIHGYIKDNDQLSEPKLIQSNNKCLHFIVLIADVKRIARVLGRRPYSKIIVVARSSQWAVQEFLAGPLSRIFINLVVISESFREEENAALEVPYILYTHELYTDGLGASKPVVLNSWSHGRFSRHVNLFQPKMTKGYFGHRFVVAATDQPPFIFKRIGTDLDGDHAEFTWDGIEIRLLKLLAERNNFSLEIVEPRELHLGSGNAVINEIITGKADIATAGIYLTKERIIEIDLSFPYFQDCSVFITLMSTALPRYRAILGPFHWQVWAALTATYLIAIFPLAFSDKFTLSHLIHNSREVENMFWYVFGTFTNCFTFVGRNSWSKTTKVTTRLLIGWYWIFTIIITSCYTGSIIAFVTLPIFPETVDTVKQLLAGFYRVGTLDHGGWEKWFINSSDFETNKLLRKLEFVPNVQTGISNTTKAFFWPYAFLGSQAELEYIVQTNYSETKSKRAMLHISNECFVPFGVALGFPKNSVYLEKINMDLRRMLQGGIIDKIFHDIRWEIQRSSSGKLSVGEESQRINSVQENGLTLEDTQGMFLLLGAGFLISAVALISEWMGGCSRRCSYKRFHSNSNNQRILNHNSMNSALEEVDSLSVNSSESRETIEGQIIHVSEDSVTVHSEYDVFDVRSKCSSTDFDKEIEEIFEKDRKGTNSLADKKQASFDNAAINFSTLNVIGESV